MVLLLKVVSRNFSTRIGSLMEISGFGMLRPFLTVCHPLLSSGIFFVNDFIEFLPFLVMEFVEVPFGVVTGGNRTKFFGPNDQPLMV